MWQTWTGGQTQASPIMSPGNGAPRAGPNLGGWHPTVIYLALLIAAEIIAVAFLTRTVLR